MRLFLHFHSRGKARSLSVEVLSGNSLRPLSPVYTDAVVQVIFYICPLKANWILKVSDIQS